MKKVKFNAKRISTKSVVNDLAKPVVIGMVGAAAGHFAGRGRNLILAGVGGLAAIATGKMSTLAPAIIGCAVVTPAKTTTTATAGLDGLKELVADGTTRSKGYVKSVLSNVGLESVANSINGVGGLGYTDPDDAYEAGYISGTNDATLVLEEGDMVAGLSGYGFSEAGHPARSIEAALANM